jgi:chorismate dehydratase
MDCEEPRKRVRLGAVSYVNTIPLIYGLDDPAQQREHHFSLSLDTPRALARRMAAGELDAALIPAAEFFRHSYELLPTGCIGCLGPVRSVYIASDKPLGECRKLLLDGASRSSNALTRILLQHLWSISPELIEPAGPANELYEPGKLPQGCDAALVIGDRALKMAGRFPVEEDLGAAWFELTNLPFVFAVWAARPGANLGAIPQLLCAAKRRARADIEKISAREAERLDLPAPAILQYLTECIRYRLGDRELAALEMFYRLMRDMDLCPVADHPRFYQDANLAEAGCA